MSGVGGIGAAAGIGDIMALRQQIIDRNQALQHVREGNAASAPAAPAAGFGNTLKAALDQVGQAQAKADHVTSAYETGEVTDIAQVMLARQQSGVAFEATLQVRNKLLSAYQDIMKLGV